MKQNTFLKIIIGILLLFNLAFIFVIWFGKPGGPQNGGRGPAKFIIKELQLNEKQKSDYEELINEHQGQMRSYREIGKDLRHDLYRLLENEDSDSVEIASIISKISENQYKIEASTFHHFAELRKICDVEQKRKLDSIIDDVLRMMGGPKPPERK